MTQNKRAFELGQQAGRAQTRSVQDREIPAVMGIERANGAISLRGGAAHDDALQYPFIYVRLYGVNEIRVASCVNVGAEPGLHVMVEKNAENQYRVTRVDDVREAEAKGEQAGDYASPPNTGGKRDLLNERNMLWGRLRLYEMGSLKVTADPFLYVDSAGAMKVFDPTVITPLDLTSRLPAADGGGNAQQRYVYVTFNPDATTPTLVAHEGTEQIFTLPLAPYGYLDIDLTAADGHYPLGPVRLQTDDTTLVEARFSASNLPRGQPGRLMVNKLGGTGASSSSLPAFGAQETVAIVSGLLDLTGHGRNIVVAAESGTADTVDSVVGLADGDAGVFQADSGDTITFADNSDIHLYNGANIALSGDDLLLLVGRGSDVVTQSVDQKGSGGGGGGTGWGSVYDVATPVDGDYAWINQGGASVSVNSDGSLFLSVTNGGSEALRIRKKAAPSTPYTVTASFIGTVYPNSSVAEMGICWRESSSGKLVVARRDASSTNFILSVTKHDAATAGVAHYVTNNSAPLATVFWWRLEDDGTDRKVYFSNDGENFLLYHTVGRTDYLTADEVGFFVGGNSSQFAGITLVSWAEA